MSNRTARDDFSQKVIETLARRANHICSNPDCRAPTAGPHSDPARALNLGVAAHICAAAPGGPRYDPAQTPEERASIENAIWLCQTCSVEIDRDPQRYPADLLRDWKRKHEDWVRQAEHLADLGRLRLDARFQLPPAPADFVGRVDEVKLILERLSESGAAAISGLTGMGGIGKTALGLAVAGRLKERYPDGQIFLDLRGTSAAPLAPADAMRHVIHSFHPEADLRALTEEQLAAEYRSLLSGKKVLLFWDNARSAAQLGPLRPPDSCAMLITSRWTFSLPGMEPLRLGLLPPPDAQSLLLEICPRISAQAAALAEACGFLPLALRIAASFLSENPDRAVGEYLARLQDRNRRLQALKVEESPDLNLEAAFELSYERLAEEGQGEAAARWRVLAVFAGSFRDLAAAALWGMERDSALDLLSKFCRYNLLTFLPSPSGRAPSASLQGGSARAGGEGGRYRLHDLLADYARAKTPPEEREAAGLRHAEHYLEVLRAADQLYRQGGQKNILAGLALFDQEAAEIAAGHAWALARRATHKRAKELCLAYPDVGTYILDLRQHPREKIAWLEAALASAREIGDRRGEGADLGNLGLAYADLGDARKAIEFYEKQLVIVREIGDRRGEGNALGNLGSAYYSLGDARKAIEFYEKQLVIVREIGDRRGEGAALGNLGLAYADLGDAHKAIEFYEQALLIDREIGDRRGEGADLANYGMALARLGEKDRARQLWQQALAIFEAIESPHAATVRGWLQWLDQAGWDNNLKRG